VVDEDTVLSWHGEAEHLGILFILIPVAPTLEHRASVKRFVSLQFLNFRQSVGLL
jgi:hypothetical protein